MFPYDHKEPQWINGFLSKKTSHARDNAHTEKKNTPSDFFFLFFWPFLPWAVEACCHVTVPSASLPGTEPSGLLSSGTGLDPAESEASLQNTATIVNVQSQQTQTTVTAWLNMVYYLRCLQPSLWCLAFNSVCLLTCIKETTHVKYPWLDLLYDSAGNKAKCSFYIYLSSTVWYLMVITSKRTYILNYKKYTHLCFFNWDFQRNLSVPLTSALNESKPPVLEQVGINKI